MYDIPSRHHTFHPAMPGSLSKNVLMVGKKTLTESGMVAPPLPDHLVRNAECRVTVGQ